MLIRGRHVTLRPPHEGDLDRLAGILEEPAVARWWGHWDRERVRTEFLDSDDDAERFVIEVDGEVVGGIELWEESDPEYRHGGIDIFLATAVHGRGLGTDAVRAAVAYLIDAQGHHRVTIDPAAANAAAIRAYEKVGFRPVGILRQYQRMADGTWEDGLLMDLLADDFTRDGGAGGMA